MTNPTTALAALDRYGWADESDRNCRLGIRHRNRGTTSTRRFSRRTADTRDIAALTGTTR